MPITVRVRVCRMLNVLELLVRQRSRGRRRHSRRHRRPRYHRRHRHQHHHWVDIVMGSNRTI